MKKTDKFFFLSGILMLISELWKQWCLTFMVYSGTYQWFYFPFQLCSLPLYLTILIPLLSGKAIQKTFYTFLMDFSLLGGMAAFFDTSGMYYPLTALTVHSFLWHIFLIFLGICAGFSGKGDITLKGFLKSTVLYGTGCLIATILNLTLHQYGTINMFYISPNYQMEQVIFGEIAKKAGNTAGIGIYILATIVGASLIHCIWIGIHHLHNRSVENIRR